MKHSRLDIIQNSLYDFYIFLRQLEILIICHKMYIFRVTKIAHPSKLVLNVRFSELTIHTTQTI